MIDDQQSKIENIKIFIILGIIFLSLIFPWIELIRNLWIYYYTNYKFICNGIIILSFLLICCNFYNDDIFICIPFYIFSFGWFSWLFTDIKNGWIYEIIFLFLPIMISIIYNIINYIISYIIYKIKDYFKDNIKLIIPDNLNLI